MAKSKRLTRAQLNAWLRQEGACVHARAWVNKQKGTPQQVWEKCDRPDWLHWLYRRSGIEIGSRLDPLMCELERVASHRPRGKLTWLKWNDRYNKELSDGYKVLFGFEIIEMAAKRRLI